MNDGYDERGEIDGLSFNTAFPVKLIRQMPTMDNTRPIKKWVLASRHAKRSRRTAQ